MPNHRKMINKESLNENWIKDIAKKHKSDPILVEKVIRAINFGIGVLCIVFLTTITLGLFYLRYFYLTF